MVGVRNKQFEGSLGLRGKKVEECFGYAERKEKSVRIDKCTSLKRTVKDLCDAFV